MLTGNQLGSSVDFDRQRGACLPRHLVHRGQVEARERARTWRFRRARESSGAPASSARRRRASQSASERNRPRYWSRGRPRRPETGSSFRRAAGVSSRRRLSLASSSGSGSTLHEAVEDDVLGIHLARWLRAAPASNPRDAAARAARAARGRYVDRASRRIRRAAQASERRVRSSAVGDFDSFAHKIRGSCLLFGRNADSVSRNTRPIARGHRASGNHRALEHRAPLEHGEDFGQSLSGGGH